jgi:hypothetical protein
MRKSVIDVATPSTSESPVTSKNSWLNLDEIATVEITSEDPLFPIENALGDAAATGWRANAKGPQVIRLNFDKPTAVHRIHLHFTDPTSDRSQELAIYARSEQGDMREVIRQQFTFSPGGSTEEIEDYTVDLASVTTLELRIDPDRAHDPTHSQHYAVLTSLRLG